MAEKESKLDENRRELEHEIDLPMDLSALRDVLLAPDFDAERRASEIIQSGAAATERHRAELQRAEADVDALLQEQERKPN